MRIHTHTQSTHAPSAAPAACGDEADLVLEQLLSGIQQPGANENRIPRSPAAGSTAQAVQQRQLLQQQHAELLSQQQQQQQRQQGQPGTRPTIRHRPTQSASPSLPAPYQPPSIISSYYTNTLYGSNAGTWRGEINA